MGLLDNLFRREDEVALALWDRVVAEGRRADWYAAGGVPDTLDGRFDMIAAVLAFVLLRLEREPDAAALSARLTERFVDDMDAQVRQIGFGDMVVGKHVGNMMAMLGGRLGAYREADTPAALDAALGRNLWRGAPAGDVAHVRDGLLAWRDRLAATSISDLAAGRVA